MAGRPRSRARRLAGKAKEVISSDPADKWSAAERLQRTEEVSRELALREEQEETGVVREEIPGEGDDEFWNEVFDRIRSGETLREICRRGGYEVRKMQKSLHSEHLSSRYVSAHEGRAVMHVQRIEGLLDDLESGRMSSDVVRVSIDARKWLATKYYPRMFGERQQIDVSTVDMTKVYVEQLKLVMSNQRARMEGISARDAEVIEHEELEG